MKTCADCGKDKPLDEFRAGRAKCKDCHRARARELYAERQPEERARKNGYVEANWLATYKARAIEYGHEPVWEDFTRADVVAHYGDRCWYCTTGPFEQLDHAEPVADGGRHTLANVRPSCRSCNIGKGNRERYNEPRTATPGPARPHTGPGSEGTAMNKIPETLRPLAQPIGSLTPYPGNPRRGRIQKIKRSLQKHGQYKPITVREQTREVLTGNQTMKAAKELGWTEIAATFYACDDDEAQIIMLLDNKLQDDSEYDHPELLAALAKVSDPEAAGFTQDELDRLIVDVGPEPEQAGEEADELGPEQPEDYKPQTKRGDVWEMGPHRLVCGDATDPRVLEELMGDEKADLMWTDPPYGVDYVGKTAEALTIQTDGAVELEPLLAAAFPAALDVLRPGAPVYVAHSDTNRMTFEATLRAAGYLVRQNLIWVKNTIVLGHSDYQYKHEPILEAETPQDAGEPAGDCNDDNCKYQEPHRHGFACDKTCSCGQVGGDAKAHEPILYGFTPGAAGRLGRGGPKWYGANNAATVFEVKKPPASREHPTMKPVALIQPMLANSCRPNGLVLDIFGGSGSTMIAADYQNQRARLVELDPKYCDVIAARWQKHSGELPLRNGKPHDFLGDGDGNGS